MLFIASIFLKKAVVYPLTKENFKKKRERATYMQAKFKILAYLLSLIVLSHRDTCAVTIVYNMRIAAPATARKELYTKLGKSLPSVLAMTYVNQTRKTRGGNDQMINAGLADYVYSFKHFYVRLDAAVGRVHEDLQAGGSTTHTEVDDLLFSTGYRHEAFPTLNLAYSFLLGIPTHNDHSFEYFQFGTGHWATGAQMDGIYTFRDGRNDSLLMALRYLHFFKAKTLVSLPTHPFCVDLALGNVIDIFVAYHKKFKKQHHLEFGYNPSFAFGVKASPSLGDALPSSGIRNTWYTAYRYIFIVKQYPMGVSLGVSYGFDNGSQLISLKRVVSAWGAYGINF